MTLPNFLGIGVPRAGTTWLHSLLAGHPDVYMPTQRKEIRFFERYHGRGLAWYSTFFCPPAQAGSYRAIGEISTQYYDCEESPGRIAAALPETRLIIMLRHPVDRAYSHYGFCLQRRNYRGSFDEFLAARPKALVKGHYSQHVKRYLQYFDRDRILALVSEDVFADPTTATATIAAFLGLAPDRFQAKTLNGKVNASSLPTHRSLYGLIVKTGRQLRKLHLEPVVDFVMRLGIQRAFSRGTTVPPLNAEDRARLSQLYLEEFDELERCLGIDVKAWRQ